MPPPTRILDSHIHLWPQTSTNPSAHAWMTPDGPLTRQYSLSDYFASTTSQSSPSSRSSPPPPLLGAIHIETDRTLHPPPHPHAQPLAELSHLRHLITGSTTPPSGPGANTLWGLVPWAPLDATPSELRAYLAEAERVAGPETWARVVGWRFLVQGVRDEGAFGAVMEAWVEGLREVAGRGWAFDVGVDARGVGVWQVERVVESLGKVGEGGRFVLSEFLFLFESFSWLAG